MNKYFLSIEFHAMGSITNFKEGDYISFICLRYGKLRIGYITEIKYIQDSLIQHTFKVVCNDGKTRTTILDYILKENSKVSNVYSKLQEDTQYHFPLRT